MMIIRILFFVLIIQSLLFSNDFFKADTLLPDSVEEKLDIKDEWLARDKGQHFAASFFSTGLMIMTANNFFDFNKNKSRTVGISLTFTLAVGKELYDSRQPGNHFSLKDLTADLLGIGLAVLVFR